MVSLVLPTIPMYQLSYDDPHSNQQEGMYRNVFRYDHLLPETYGAHTLDVGIPYSVAGNQLQDTFLPFMAGDNAEYIKNLKLSAEAEAQMIFLASSFTSSQGVTITVSNDPVFMLTGERYNRWGVKTDVKMVIYPNPHSPANEFPLAFFFDGNVTSPLGAGQIVIVEDLIRFVKNFPWIPLYEDNTNTNVYNVGDLSFKENTARNDINSKALFAVVRTNNAFTLDLRDPGNVGYSLDVTQVPNTFKLSTYYEAWLNSDLTNFPPNPKGSVISFTNTDILRVVGTKGHVSVEAHWKLHNGIPNLVFYVSHPDNDKYNAFINHIISDIEERIESMAYIMWWNRPF